MADKRPSRTGNEQPAEDSRRKSPSSHSGSKPEARKGSSSQFRLVADEDLFAGPHEPNDESPTIISTKHGEAIQAARGSSDLHGRRLAHYELGEPIGVGGMAAVIRARDTQLDRVVALKILPPEMAKDHENVRRFHQEARAAAKLDHENIARVFYCGEDQGLHFIAFEFVEGDNLRMILERRGRIPVGEALRYVRQVATGLEHAASRGVVHRDIKPSNIIITPTGKAKVVDMGLARSLEPHADDGLTQSGVTLGTFDYISPEQALEPREADSRSDIYSLGCTFYHMLTGHPAVPEGTAAKKLHHHQHIAPTDPRQLNPEIPDDVALVLSKMMAKDPTQRYQRPLQLVQHLSQISKKYDGDASHETLFVDLNIPAEPTSRPMLMVCLAVLTLAGVLFALSLAPSRDKKIDPPAIVKQSPTIDKKPPVELPKTVTPPIVTVLRTEDDLQKAIDRAMGSEKTTIVLEHDIELTGKLKLTGGEKSRPLVEIVGAERQPVKLTLTVDKAPTSALAGLRVEGAGVMFRNVRFEIVADGVKVGDVPVSAVSLGNGSVAEFDQCVYSQSGLPIEALPKRVPAASVLVEASRASAEAPRATFRDCAFLTGQTAIAVVGSGRVIARDCAFSSLGSLVQLKGVGGEPTVTLEHCSAYVKSGPVFRIDDDTNCQINVDYCIFTVPKGAEKGEKILIRQTDTDSTRVSYRGRSNFYRLLGLWTNGPGGNGDIVTYDSPAAFADKGRRGSEDKNSQFLKLDDSSFPFALETVRGDELAAFQVTPLRELQTPSEKHPEHPMLGIRKYLGTYVTKLAPLAVEPAPMVADDKPGPNEAILEPDGLSDGRLPEGKSLITLKPTAVSSEFFLKWKEVDSDLTIRGFKDTMPTVHFAENKVYRDAFLFRLVSGKLSLENLHIVIEPDREGRTSQSLVLMAGLGACNLKNCIVTMKPRPGSKTALSVVSVNAAEKGEMMMNDPKLEAVPTVTISDCFLRGDGDVLSLKESRPISMQVSRSLAILGGSLLHQQQAAPKDVGGKEPPATDIIALRMSGSAFFFAEPLFAMQNGKVRPGHQHPLRVEAADQCLFTTLDDRPLVSLETLEAPEKLAAIFEWKGMGNAYVQFKTAPVLEQTLADFRLDEAGWRETADRGSLFVPNGFKTLPTRLYLHAAKPGDPVIRSESLDDLQSYMQSLPRFQLPE